MAVHRPRCRWLIVAAVSAIITGMCGAVVTAQAAGQNWSGRYTVVSYASQKAGTSAAARQAEPDFSAPYTFATQCSSRCVATVLDGPAPSNPTIPQPQRYVWNGSQWTFAYDWQWECYHGEGAARLYSPAQSWVSYTPQPDGSLQGTWHTDILAGWCQGNVLMPVAAYPA